MWGRLLALIQAYIPRDLVEVSVFLLCFGFFIVALVMQVECAWYITHFPLSSVEGRCGNPQRKDMLEALTTLVTLLIAFLSGKRTGYNNKEYDRHYKYKDDDED